MLTCGLKMIKFFTRKNITSQTCVRILQREVKTPQKMSSLTVYLFVGGSLLATNRNRMGILTMNTCAD